MLITLAGVIGVGKSSMTQILADLLDTKAVYEPVEENPLLEKFYEDKDKYGFLFQIDMISKRFELIQDAMSVDNGILDRSIFEDSIFLDQLYQQGHVDELERNVYHKLLNRMLKELEPLPKKTPDLMIVLNCTFEEEIKRINDRARDFEKVNEGTELYEYFKLHHENYQKWIEKDLGFPKLVFDVTEMDFVNNLQHRQEIVSQIIDKLYEVEALTSKQAVEAYKELFVLDTNQEAVMKFYNHANGNGIEVSYHVVAHYWDIERADN